jgi:hypothetical protein
MNKHIYQVGQYYQTGYGFLVKIIYIADPVEARSGFGMIVMRVDENLKPEGTTFELSSDGISSNGESMLVERYIPERPFITIIYKYKYNTSPVEYSIGSVTVTPGSSENIVASSISEGDDISGVLKNYGFQEGVSRIAINIHKIKPSECL